MTTVTLQFVDGCPSWRVVDEQLAELASDFGFRLERHRLTGLAEAERAGFAGSPTILVDGHDLVADDAQPVGLTCRLYATSAGIRGRPSPAELREALLRTLERG